MKKQQPWFKLYSPNYRPYYKGRYKEYAEVFYQLRQRKGIILIDTYQRILGPNVFSPLMVKMSNADAFVSGLPYDYPDVIRPALQIQHTKTGTHRTSGV